MATDAQTKANLQSASTTRSLICLSLLLTLIADTHASHGETLMHLTLWSWILHTLYFAIPLAKAPFLVRLLHGPSLGGAHALFSMYVWTLTVNPRMEFDLAPPGRSDAVILLRAAWLHVMPVVFHWVDLLACDQANMLLLQQAYRGHSGKLLQFWACLGGYFAMGLTWEYFNGDAGATYNVTVVSTETYVNVSKALGVVSCVLVFFAWRGPIFNP